MSSRKPTFVVMNTQSCGFPPSAHTFSTPSSSRPPPPCDEFPANPFLKSGTMEPNELTEVKKVLHVRVDVPGCSEEDLMLWVDLGGMIHFYVKAPEDPTRGFGGRTYGGSFAFNPKLFKVEEHKVQVKDGIMWLDVPKRSSKK